MAFGDKLKADMTDIFYLRDKILIKSGDNMTKPQNVASRFSKKFLLLLKYDFGPFGSFSGHKKKIGKISIKRIFFSKNFSEN